MKANTNRAAKTAKNGLDIKRRTKMAQVVIREDPDVKPRPKKHKAIVITRPKFATATFGIVGTAPYVQNKFSDRVRQGIREKQEAGSTSGSRKVREAKDFGALYEGAIHYSEKGWYGIPAPAFRAAMIKACSLVGFKMTIAKLAIFVIADGYDADDMSPLVRITGEPQQFEAVVRNATGVIDIRIRPRWNEWSANITVQYDTDQFTQEDIAALLMRAGVQVGVGEGRPCSKSSYGQGWGTFTIVEM